MCERLYIAAMLVTHLWPHTVESDKGLIEDPRSKAKELEVDKGKRLWTGYHSLVGTGEQWKTNNILKICKNVMSIILIANTDTALTLGWIGSKEDQTGKGRREGRMYLCV